MTKVFVSGCYDILHAGHIEFFKAARAFGDSLTVCFASDEVYRAWKGRDPSMPEAARRAILEELRCVDEVVMGNRDGVVFDFRDAFHTSEADIIVSSSDDKYAMQKKDWCELWGKRYVQIPKPTGYQISTTAIREKMAK